MNNLRTIFNENLLNVFQIKLPIWCNSTLTQDYVGEEKAPIQVNKTLTHIFRQIFEFAASTFVDFSNIQSEIEYTHELAKLTVDVFKLYKLYRNQSIGIYMDSSFSKISRVYSSYSSTQTTSLMKNSTTGRNVSGDRPDLCIVNDNSIVLLKGEFKNSPADFQNALKELNSKHFVTNAHNNSSIEIGSFALVAAGQNLELYYGDCNKDFGAMNSVFICNLNDAKQKLLLVKNMICISYLMQLISSRNPYSSQSIHLFRPVERKNDNQKVLRSVSFISNNIVVKKVLIEWIEEETKTDYQIYKKNLCKFYMRILPNAMNCATFVKMEEDLTYLYIYTKPICENSTMVSNLKTLKKLFREILEATSSLHIQNYAHCDIRWPNIVYDVRNSKYLLIDFENAKPFCELNCVKKHVYKCVSSQTDLNMIILLLNELSDNFIAENKEFIDKLKKKLCDNKKNNLKSVIDFLKD